MIHFPYCEKAIVFFRTKAYYSCFSYHSNNFKSSEDQFCKLLLMIRNKIYLTSNGVISCQNVKGVIFRALLKKDLTGNTIPEVGEN